MAERKALEGYMKWFGPEPRAYDAFPLSREPEPSVQVLKPIPRMSKKKAKKELRKLSKSLVGINDPIQFAAKVNQEYAERK